MTQKELLYFEDAIGHEGNIIKLVSNMINNLENEELKSFMQSELLKHENLKENLINMLGEKSNGW